MRKVAVVIPHYGNIRDTLDCLASVYSAETGNIDLKVIVVLNAGSDNSEAKLLKKFSSLQVIVPGNNTGFGRAVNLGMKKTASLRIDFFIILNNDTVIAADTIRKTTDYLEDHPETGIISPKIYFYKGQEFHKDRYRPRDLGRVIWYAGGIIDWQNVYAGHRGVDEIDKGQYDRIVDTDFATGCCMIIRHKVLEQIGYFNEKYFLYFEDVEYSLVTRKSGFQVKYFPKTHLWHKNAASSGKPGSPVHIYYQTRNRLYFGYRFAGLRVKKSLFIDSFRSLFKGKPYSRAVIDYYSGRMGKAEI